jgi:holo-[acyl-carrier protein] synthase
VSTGQPAAATVAVGVDLVETARVARLLAHHPERFPRRHFTPAERAQCGRDAKRLAARWAAKEAASKALGTGIGLVGWHDIEVLCRPGGWPELHLHGAAQARAAALGWSRWSVSLSHTGDHAVAVVAAVGAGCPPGVPGG